MRLNTLNSLWMALALLLILAAPGYAQIRMDDLGYHQAKPLEPGGGIEMADSDDTIDGQAALGDGFIVFKFKLTDIDPIADDGSDVRVTCILIQNLGTATGGGGTSGTGTSGSSGIDIEEDDIAQVMVMDQDSNSVAPPVEPSETGEVDFSGECDELAQTNNPGNAQISWEAVFEPDFIIPDDGSEVFQVAVRVNDTTLLEDESQNHTLLLRATVQVEEIVGSPPSPTKFIERVTDSSTELIWNGGINSWTEDSYAINPLMPGEKGVVSRFTICDWDANEYQLIINRFWVKQDEPGTATSSDVVSLDLYRVEGFTRSLLASRTPDGDFHRSSGAANGMPLPGGNADDNVDDPRFALTVPDDTCYTFELEAQVSQFAFKGHIIKPRIQISSEEPRGTPINDTVNPEIVTGVGTLIGKGLISIPDVRLIGKPGNVPLRVEGVQLPGFGTLQVGPWGKLQYNPNVVQIKSITGMDPYVVDATEIDNRSGEARFTVRLDPLKGNPFLTSFQEGTVAYIRVEPIGPPGSKFRWTLTYDCFELVTQMNCLPTGFPYPNTPNQNPNNDISVQTGTLTLVYPGDVDLDGQPTVSDAVKVATAILPCSNGPNPTLPSPDDSPPPTSGVFDPTNTTANLILTDEQKSIGDVASPFAAEDEIPDCDTLTSADVREIARLAINFGEEPAPRPIGSAVPGAIEKPWYGFLSDLWDWLTNASSKVAALSLEFNDAAQSLDVSFDVPGSALGGIQGWLSFDPTLMQVENLAGLGGYEVMAAKINNFSGEVRFVVLAPRGYGSTQGTALRLNVSGTGPALAASLHVQYLIDEDGADIPFLLEQSQQYAFDPNALRLTAAQALSQGNGSFRFQALGSGITAVQVQIYDLAGGAVFDQEVSGNALTFNGLSHNGKPLANGVYLYVLTAKGAHGATMRTDVKKLVILR